MLLDIAYKIIVIILYARLLLIDESLDHESQCGFRPGRGCMDAIFTIQIALKKRREYGLESWFCLLDMVKAFENCFISKTKRNASEDSCKVWCSK